MKFYCVRYLYRSIAPGRTMKDKCFASMTLLILCCLFFPSVTVGASVQGRAGIELELPGEINDFRTCAIVGLQRTPELKRSKMEIDIRRLDEDDSRWSYVPTLRLSSQYYLAENEATISFNAVNYRPWEPYYSLQVRQLITQIVTFNHIKQTAEALQNLADTLLKLIAFSEIDEQYREIVSLYEKKLRYVEKLQETDVVASFEHEIEKQTLEYVIVEKERNSAQRRALIEGLCITLDLPEPAIFNFDRDAVLLQILGSVELPEQIDIAAPEQSLDQQIMARKRVLQEKRILLAYSKYMPDFSLGIRSPDVLNVSIDEENDYYFYVGMDLTLWDGKKRSRDITRQELLLRQLRLESREVENKDSVKWLQAMQKLTLARSEYNLSSSVVKLKMLEMKKKEFHYNQGTIKLPQVVSHQVEIHREKIREIMKKLELQRAWLQLRHLSGQLLKDTVNVSMPEMPYE